MIPDGLHAGPMVRPFLRWIYDGSQDHPVPERPAPTARPDCQTARVLLLHGRHGTAGMHTRGDVCGMDLPSLTGARMQIIMAEAGGRLGCKMPGFGAGAAGS
jgi:hypothetical protein